MQRAYPKKGGHQKRADFAKTNIVDYQKTWTDMAAYNMRMFLLSTATTHLGNVRN